MRTELAQWNKKKKNEDKGPAPTLPVRKVYTFNGATGEAITAQAHRCPDQSMLLLADELAGMFKSANQYRPGSDEEDLLEYWSGSGKKILRVGGIKVDVKNVNLSIFGNIQPDVLARFMGDGTDANGKFARFDFVQQPLTATHLSTKDAPCTLTPALAKLYAYLDSLTDTQFELSTQAHELFVKFYNYCNDKLYAEEKQGARAMLSKMPEKLGKVATILHCIEAYGSGKAPEREIDCDTMRVAAKFVGYCRRQVENMNSQIVTPSALAPRLIKILDLAKRKGGTVTARDVSKSFNSTHRLTSQQIKECFAELVALNYGTTTTKGVSISFILESVSPVSPVACMSDSVRVVAGDSPIPTMSPVPPLLTDLRDLNEQSGDKWGHTGDNPAPTLEPISSKALSTTGDSGDTISPLSESSETLMQSCTTPELEKTESTKNVKKTEPKKRPIGIGDTVVIAYSDSPVYRGVKGRVIGVSKMADGLKGLRVEFDKLIRGISDGIFPPGDLLRFQQ